MGVESGDNFKEDVLDSVKVIVGVTIIVISVEVAELPTSNWLIKLLLQDKFIIKNKLINTKLKLL